MAFYNTVFISMELFCVTQFYIRLQWKHWVFKYFVAFYIPVNLKLITYFEQVKNILTKFSYYAFGYFNGIR